MDGWCWLFVIYGFCWLFVSCALMFNSVVMCGSYMVYVCVLCLRLTLVCSMACLVLCLDAFCLDFWFTAWVDLRSGFV